MVTGRVSQLRNPKPALRFNLLWPEQRVHSGAQERRSELWKVTGVDRTMAQKQ